ncbi:Aste57867_24580 [Aphanomyces stellatus]|uniref:Aste57867_24580 protein n=1 Tax=Aphanomyces stellatus TaxID=120398 RepID=A0A485LQU9_9STRA|nr:hypothetical protein As57867_024502 [Aphanomyces stellatus]VFU01219.1 Aste57867_24580 [Aphanomyces stellatus]
MGVVETPKATTPDVLYRTLTTPEVADATAAPPSGPSRSFVSLFRFADRTDLVLLSVGTLFSIAWGVNAPLTWVFFGNSINAFSPFDHAQVATTSRDYLVLAFAQFAALLGSHVCFGISAERQIKAMRIACLRHAMYLDMGWYDTTTAASELATRLAGDTVKIKAGMGDKLAGVVRMVFQVAASFAWGFAKGWNVTLVMCGVMPFMVVALACLANELAQLASKSQAAYAAAGAVAEESLAAMRTVASLNGQARAQATYDASVDAAKDEGLRVSRTLAICAGVFFMCQWLTYAVGMWYGSKLVANQNDAVHDPGHAFSAFYLVFNGTLALALLTPGLGDVAAAVGSAKTLTAVLDQPIAVDASNASAGVVPTGRCAGRITVKNVSFAYPSRPDHPILNRYSVTIEAGTTVALVGGSGSGKSTLVALLERFYDPQHGSIELDGVDIATLQVRWLRRQIGLVSQEPILFATTVRDNIALGRCESDVVTQAQVEAAAKLANAHEFILGLPHGYDTMVTGTLVSGGQKQRIAIARAMIREPAILVLDEATSALDNESERVVQAALNNLLQHTTQMTTIVIAHRLSTVRTADKIVVLGDGAVVEEGSHDQLMQHVDGHYKTMVEAQAAHATAVDTQPSHAVVVASSQQSALLREPRESTSSITMVKDDTLVVAPHDTKKPLAGEPTAKTAVATASLARIFALSSPQRAFFLAGLVASLANGFAQPGISLIVARIVSLLTTQYAAFVHSRRRHDDSIVSQAYLDTMYTDVSRTCLWFVGVAILMGVVWFAQTYAFRVIADTLTARLRTMHFAALCRQDIGFLDETTTGALTADLATQATKVSLVAGENQLRLLQSAFIVLAAFLIGFAWGSWQLTLVMLVIFPMMLIGMTRRVAMMQDKDGADNLAASGALASEAIAHARTVAAYGLQPALVTRYDALLAAPLVDGVREAKANGGLNALVSFSLSLMFAACFYIGGILVEHDTITFAQLIRTVMALFMASVGVSESASFIGDADAAKKAAATIFAVVDRRPAVDASPDHGVVPAAGGAGQIEFRDVSFAYPSRPDVPVLVHFHVTIEAGQTVAFCGPSGSGKSTVVALLERFYNPTTGSIWLDGHDITTLNVPWLRHRLGLVGQEPVLFAGTIADNIARGLVDDDAHCVTPDELQQRVQAAALQANAHQFISQFPDGYATQVGLKGSQLSGGQKQRIAIARAMLKNPRVLLLDEATSALDVESERLVQDALDRLVAESRRTTLVIAHRLSTIRNADKICVVSGGRVAEQGTHDELLGANGLYTALVAATADNE